MGGGEGEHRPKRIEVAQQRRFAGDDQHPGENREEHDREPGRAVAVVQLGEDARQLAVLGERPREARHADQAGVGSDQEDRRGQYPDVVAGDGQERAVQTQAADDAEDGVIFVASGEFGGVMARVVDDGQRRERDHGDPGVDRQHCDHDEVDRARDIAARILCLLGHIGNGLDARVGDHRHRQREEHLGPAGRGAEVDLVDKQRGIQHQHEAHEHEQDLRAEIGHGEDQVQARRLAQAPYVQPDQQRDRDQPTDDVARVVCESGEERAQVVRHKERGDGDRDDVVEAERPAGEEGDDVVEGMARKRRGAARLGEHRGALGVGLGRQDEQHTGEHEHQRRQSQGVRGDEAEGVVDRRADVAVGRGEQARNADRAAQSVLG